MSSSKFLAKIFCRNICLKYFRLIFTVVDNLRGLSLFEEEQDQAAGGCEAEQEDGDLTGELDMKQKQKYQPGS